MDDEKPMIEERQERAPRDVYGGRMLEKKGKGFTRTVFVLACDSCGLRIGEDDRLRVCNKPECRRKICDDCSFSYEGQIYCGKCLKSKLGIEEPDMNVLHAIIESKRMDIPGIANNLGASPRAVRKSIRRLVRAKLVSRCSVSIFMQFEPTTSAFYNQLAITRLFTQAQSEEP